MSSRLTQPKGSVSKEINKQSIARLTNSKLTEIDYLKNGLSIDSLKYVYDEITETIFKVNGTGFIQSWSLENDNIISVITNTGTYFFTKFGILYDKKIVEDFGILGDGSNIDMARWNEALTWLSSGSFRVLSTSHNKKYIISQPMVLSFSSGVIGCNFIMNGALYPTTSVNNALTISEANYSFFDLKVVGDGYIQSSVDYSIADPVNARQAFIINSCRACTVNVWGNGFNGRVLRTKGTGTTKMSFINLSIKTGESSCGQACFLEATSDAYGVIQNAQTQWDYYGSVLKNLTDVTITYWEYGNKNSSVPALFLDNCGSVYIGNATGGSSWDSDTSNTLKISNGQGIFASHLQVGEAYLGLLIEGDGTVGDKPTVTIDYLLSYKTNTVVKLNNTTGVKINNGLCDNTYHGIVYTGNIFNCHINMDGRNNFTDMHFADTGTIIDSLYIGGSMYSTVNANFVSMINATVKYLSIKDTYINTLGRYVYIPVDNQCYINGGKWSGSVSSSPIANRPKLIHGIDGIKTKYLNASIVFGSGTVAGTTQTITHGLWSTPFEISMTPYTNSPPPTITFGNIVVTALNSTSITLMYTGSTSSTAIYVIVSLIAESRID